MQDVQSDPIELDPPPRHRRRSQAHLQHAAVEDRDAIPGPDERRRVGLLDHRRTAQRRARTQRGRATEPDSRGRDRARTTPHARPSGRSGSAAVSAASAAAPSRRRGARHDAGGGPQIDQLDRLIDEARTRTGARARIRTPQQQPPSRRCPAARRRSGPAARSSGPRSAATRSGSPLTPRRSDAARAVRRAAWAQSSRSTSARRCDVERVPSAPSTVRMPVNPGLRRWPPRRPSRGPGAVGSGRCPSPDARRRPGRVPGPAPPNAISASSRMSSPALDGDQPDRVGHVLVGDLARWPAPWRADRARSRRPTRATASLARRDVQRHVATQEVVGVQPAQDEVGVGHGRRPPRPVRTPPAPAQPRRCAGRRGACRPDRPRRRSRPRLPMCARRRSAG